MKGSTTLVSPAIVISSRPRRVMLVFSPGPKIDSSCFGIGIGISNLMPPVVASVVTWRDATDASTLSRHASSRLATIT